MFDNLGNLPLHPLVVHAAVVGIPLAALLAFLFAFPRTREWARWPLAITVVGATAVTFRRQAEWSGLRGGAGHQAWKPGGRFDLAAFAARQSAVLYHDRLCGHRPAQCVPGLEANLRLAQQAQPSSPPSSALCCRPSWWQQRSLHCSGSSGSAISAHVRCGIRHRSAPVLTASAAEMSP